jgi:hypothetical protein
MEYTVTGYRDNDLVRKAIIQKFLCMSVLHSDMQCAIAQCKYATARYNTIAVIVYDSSWCISIFCTVLKLEWVLVDHTRIVSNMCVICWRACCLLCV